MVGPSKILTVSYGTFSCTLEGFDDPFATMRGIAEYFRDLAADDRYFGAEPPTPDADMLHRIAEREIRQPVEARIDDNGVTLRQLDDAGQEQSSATPGLAPSSFTEPAEAADQDSAEEAGDNAPTETPTVSAESVAAKLARIRAVVSEQEPEAEDEPEIDEAFVSEPISAAFEDVAEDEPAGDNIEDVVEAEDIDLAAVADAVATAEAAATEEESAPEEGDAVADDVVAADESDTMVAPDDEVSDEMAADEAVQPVEDETEEEAEATEVSLADSETADAETEVEAETDADEVAVEAPDVSEDETEEMAAISDDVEADSAEAEEDEIGSDENQAPLDLSALAAVDDSDADDLNDDDEADAEPDPSAIARVVKMRRADFEAAVSGGELTEVKESDEIAAEVAAIDVEEELESSLSAEDEAELMATLEQVRRESDAEQRAEKEGRALLENDTIESNTNSVSRILEVTNTEMEETEGTRRRSAIAHLKAAVAATRADKLLSRKRAEEDADELNQYRDDLARVVRPKRPAEPTERRMPPLMLVTEQRVDSGEKTQPPLDADNASVRPRRITSGNLALEEEDDVQDHEVGENIFRDAGSFSEFAEQMGATELPDLLEAAAAYSSFVEGQPHFSRPQIMKAVAAIKEEEYTREEGLRSFGQLLRRGKIRKIKRGQFKVADNTRFNPEARAAGE